MRERSSYVAEAAPIGDVGDQLGDLLRGVAGGMDGPEAAIADFEGVAVFEGHMIVVIDVLVFPVFVAVI